MKIPSPIILAIEQIKKSVMYNLKQTYRQCIKFYVVRITHMCVCVAAFRCCSKPSFAPASSVIQLPVPNDGWHLYIKTPDVLYIVCDGV